MAYYVASKESKRRFLLPLYVIFFVFGIEICDYLETCRFYKPLRFLCLLSRLAIHCAMPPIFIFHMYRLTQCIEKNNNDFTAVFIADILLAAVTMIMYEFFLVRQQKIRQFLMTLLDLGYPSLLKRSLWAYVAVTACCILPFVTCPYGIICAGSNLNMHKNKHENVTLDTFHSLFMHNIYWHYVWLTIFRPFTLLTCALFLYICFVFTSTFRDLDARERFPSVLTFIQRHQIVCCHLQRAESLFSSILFVACSSDVITTTFFLRSVSLGSNIATWKPTLLPYVILNFGLFVSRILAASAVNSQVTESLQGMDLMFNRLLNSNSVNSILTLAKINCYIQRLSINPPALTGGGFFTMKRGCILSVGSAILTYILVLYQSF